MRGDAVLADHRSARGLLNQLPAMELVLDTDGLSVTTKLGGEPRSSTPPAAGGDSTPPTPSSIECTASNQKQWVLSEVADLDLDGTMVVEEDADLDFLEDRNLELLPLPPPADTGVVYTGEAAPAVCPHCNGERVGFGRYRERDKPRATNLLRNWNHKLGYNGPPYCKACSESFCSHLIRLQNKPVCGETVAYRPRAH